MDRIAGVIEFLGKSIPVSGGWRYHHGKISCRLNHLQLQDTLIRNPFLQTRQKLVSEDAGKLHRVENKLATSGLLSSQEYREHVFTQFVSSGREVSAKICIDADNTHLRLAKKRKKNRKKLLKQKKQFVPTVLQERAIREIVVVSCGVQSRGLCFTASTLRDALKAKKNVTKAILSSGALRPNQFSIDISYKAVRDSEGDYQLSYSCSVKIMAPPDTDMAYAYVLRKHP